MALSRALGPPPAGTGALSGPSTSTAGGKHQEVRPLQVCVVYWGVSVGATTHWPSHHLPLLSPLGMPRPDIPPTIGGRDGIDGQLGVRPVSAPPPHHLPFPSTTFPPSLPPQITSTCPGSKGWVWRASPPSPSPAPAHLTRPATLDEGPVRAMVPNSTVWWLKGGPNLLYAMHLICLTKLFFPSSHRCSAVESPSSETRSRGYCHSCARIARAHGWCAPWE